MIKNKKWEEAQRMYKIKMHVFDSSIESYVSQNMTTESERLQLRIVRQNPKNHWKSISNIVVLFNPS